MAIVLHPGRIVRIAKYANTHPARGLLCRVLTVAPDAALPPRLCRVLVLEVNEPAWKTNIGEGELLALTERQVELQEKHGLPHEFAAAVHNALGEISIGEAQAAISTYVKEFFAA